jgi:hypothetical protein
LPTLPAARSEKPPLLARTKTVKQPVIAALIRKRSDQLRLEEVEFVPGPGTLAGSQGVAPASAAIDGRKPATIGSGLSAPVRRCEP